MKMLNTNCLLLLMLINFQSYSQDYSIAREWNELNLYGLDRSFFRPTVNTRNLWHVSTGMYDAWAAYDQVSDPYFLGNIVGEYETTFTGVAIPPTEQEIISAQEEAISYAAYRIMSYKFENLPSTNEIEVLAALDSLMDVLEYPISITSTDYVNDGPAALGNYIADNIIAFGLQDGAFEEDGFDNQYYEPVNEELVTQFDGNPNMTDPNRWQPLSLVIATDALGNPLPIYTPKFLSAEWGNVIPFSLNEEEITLYARDDNFYQVYMDPGIPHLLDEVTEESGLNDSYKKEFVMPAIFSALLDPADGVMMDISPSSIGNIPNVTDYENYYDFFEGTDSSLGHETNPFTGLEYESQIVPRADYARVITNYWSPAYQKPSSQIWFNILNAVSNHPEHEKKWKGEGEVLSDLEWDIKSYFTLGGAMHDCAIAAWSAKGWYDYPRPISAIRFMGDQGQSSDITLPNYSPSGLPLIPDYIELVTTDAPLVGADQEHINKLKIKSWRGKDYLDQINLFGGIIDGVQDSTVAGVGWILSEDWWPYQRYLYTSPPYGSHVSGAAAFSHGAAEVLAQITGDEYFPGGLGSAPIEMNTFLSFEEGPTVNMELQWATYKDAAHQSSLSFIYGGVQTANGVIKGMDLGTEIGESSLDYAENFITPIIPEGISHAVNTDLINDDFAGNEFTLSIFYNNPMNEDSSPMLNFNNDLSQTLTLSDEIWISDTEFQWTYSTQDANETFPNIQGVISGAESEEGISQLDYSFDGTFSIDTENPIVLSDSFSESIINDLSTGSQFQVILSFNETMDQANNPILNFIPQIPSSLSENADNQWISPQEYQFVYDISDGEDEMILSSIYSQTTDLAGNLAVNYFSIEEVLIDNRNPQVTVLANTYDVTEENIGENGFELFIIFDENMDNSITPTVTFPEENPTSSITLNEEEWIGSTYRIRYNVNEELTPLPYIDISITNASDSQGNQMNGLDMIDYFSIDLDTYLSIEELELNQLMVFPNPVFQGENISILLENIQAYEINVYDSLGKLVRCNSELTENNKAEFSSAEFTAGNYFIKLISQNDQKVYRIQVMK